MREAHAALDVAVTVAFGFVEKAQMLQQILDLNYAVATAIKAGMSVTGPGIPSGIKDPAALLTADRLGMSEPAAAATRSNQDPLGTL